MDLLTPFSQSQPQHWGSVLLPRALRLPLNPSEVSPPGAGFERTELEIGFGNGEYTVHHAASQPGLLLFGMEVSQGCLLRCAKRARGLNNLRLIRTDARYMMKELFADEALDRVYMNFPCPWPKKRHAHRRVTAREFSDDLAAVLKMGGTFELLTDEEWYADEVRRLLGAHEALELRSFELNPSRAITTKYERRWLEQGKDLYRLTFVKDKHFSVTRRCWGEQDMHVKTGQPLNEDLLPALVGAVGARGMARWVFKKYYTGTGGKREFLLEALTTDDEFEQRFYLKLLPRIGDTLIKLDSTAQIFLTPAVRGAMEDLAARLITGAGEGEA